MMFLQNLSSAAMEQALNASWQRMQIIGTNIANEDTPGYKAKRLQFESLLSNEMSAIRNSSISRRGALERISSVQPTVYEDTSTITRADGNNVDLNNEQIESTRIQYQYQALSQKISNHYSILQYAISGGR